MKAKLIEKFASRAFLLTLGTAVTLFAQGNTLEALISVGIYVLGDRGLAAVQTIKALPVK